MSRLLLVLVLAPVWAEPGWMALFDGKSGAGFRAPVTPEFPAESWRIADGALHPVAANRKFDLWSVEKFRNFVLEFEFKLEPGANGGIKYLVQRARAARVRDGKWLPPDQSAEQPGDRYVEGTQGLEYQIVDDTAAGEAIDPKRRTGAMYSLLAPTGAEPTGPGVFHKARIVVDGDRIEHHLNGRIVVTAHLGSPEMEAAWDASRREDIKRLRALEKRETPIAITHHGSQVWYRNVRVQRLP